LINLFTNLDSNFTEHNTEIRRIFVDGNSVVVDTIWSGYHVGEYVGINPSGKFFRIPMVWIFDFMFDKVITAKQFMDYSQLMKLSQ
jgi:predicted ester cyclase